MSVDLEQFHQVFFEESFEGLDIMETGLMELDLGAANSEDINTIFRAAHSIKGGSGTFGFQGIADFTHVMETLLDEMRDGRRQVTREAVDSLLKSVDILRMMMNCEQDKSDPDTDTIKRQLTELEAILGTSSGGGEVAAETTSSSSTSSGAGWNIVFEPDANMMLTGNDPLRIIRELAELGEIEVNTHQEKLPVFSALEPENCYLSWDIILHGDIAESVIKDVFLWVEDE
ncbi:MAG: Hpt domain-containing protein, partial [Gammaproteobacteria bacterium]|nr:Hpt domain-containing protein [Gammaproteobacteria bacterium]MCW9005897.1 Hpt domain-containing protein [Gammaproteobacteria bacterium]